MPSKLVVDRQKSAGAVVAAGRTHAGKVAATLATLLKGHLRKGESMPDVSLLVELTVRMLEDAARDMVAADEADLKERGDDAEPRERRDEAAARLYATLVELREIAIGLYGGAEAAKLGLAGTTPQDPVALSRFAGEIASAIGGKLPPSRVKGASLKGDVFAKRIKSERAPVDAALKDVAREAREAEATLTAKNAALASYDERFQGCAAFLAGLFRLAGEAELAARVRPSTRRPGQRESSEEEVPEPATAAAAAPGSGEPRT